ncbi:phage holin family protein [Hydrogenophaga sp.]|uniref:phage holin family protein n=1 Tax=Hydrogenophaga sp. TaxID=1904254 RepID=UPI002620C5FD|nr:phage holin family protein [Hydrogenophaga sp.]MDM7949289.1 phage holin family protein [Hydrogenophaga sp.]
MDKPPPTRLSASLKGLAGTVLTLLQVRLELLGVETQEEVVRVVGLLLWGVAAALLLSLGLGFLAVFITVALWETQRLLALGVFATLFLTLGGIATWIAYQRVRRESTLFASSLAELRQDREQLRS